MPKELSIDEKAELLAKEVGDSLTKFIEVVKRELGEIKFKGIEFTKMDITFQIDPSGIRNSTITCRIWTSAIEGIASTDESESRYFFYPHSKRDLQMIFWLIQHWRQDIIENHLEKLKSKPAKTLFDS
jgi:hypothetical protein